MRKKLRIVVDTREEPSGVPEYLSRLGVRVDFDQMPVGDYIVGPGVAVERKSLGDLLSSIFDGRLFKQCAELETSFDKPFLMLEGDFLEVNEMANNPKIFYGALASIALKTGVKVLYSPNPEVSALLLGELAEHASGEHRRGPLLSKMKKPTDQDQLQLSITASLPGVGAVLADRLLRAFFNPRGVFIATVPELARVDGIGHARALRINNILGRPYGSRASARQMKLGDV